MKKIMSVFLSVLLIISLSISAFAYTPHEDDLLITEEVEATVLEDDAQIAGITYYITGYGYGSGVSRVSYFIDSAIITVTGSDGSSFSTYIAGENYIEFPTTPGCVYTVTSNRLPPSTWTSY